MAQQTAVEWLVNELQLHGYDHTINHAKQMEKEQMLWFFRKFLMINEESNNHYIKEFEQYYYEKFANK